MTTNFKVDDRFPDSELSNHEKELIRLFSLTQPGSMKRYLEFTNGYPLILVFYRSFFCPRAYQQLPQSILKKFNRFVFHNRSGQMVRLPSVPVGYLSSKEQYVGLT
ncbi:hypothetical protein IFO70_36290 [Phormidium tenue FACHB-886]|nr:hypothetical protein [Phormidium tenue FACHB-886]